MPSRGVKGKPRRDSTPDAFAFTSVTDAAPGVFYTSEEIQITGANAVMSATTTLLAYSINGGLFTAVTPFTVQPGANIRVRLKSSLTPGGDAVGALTIGGVIATFAVTTAAAPTPPDPFSFTSVTDAALNTPYTSNTVTLNMVGPAPGVVANGLVSLDGADFTSAPVVVGDGSQIRLKRTSSSEYETQVSASFTVLGVTGTFDITTIALEPPVDTILFGVNTRSGFGGASGPWLAGSTISGEGASDWTLNGDNLLVPSGTYGAAKTFSKAAGQSYTLGFSDGSQVTVTLVAGEAHCAATSADTSSSFQLKTYLQTAGFSGEIVGRDGYVNPTGAFWRIKPPAAGYSGSITVRSENPTAGNDADGNPIRGGGFQIGALAFDPGSLAVIPVTFEDVTFYSGDDTVRANFLGYTSTTTGRGVGATRCRFENGSSVSAANRNDGMSVRGATCHQCAFVRLDKGVALGTPNGEVRSLVSQSVFKECSDAIQRSGQNTRTEENFGYDFLVETGAHPDADQHLGALTANIATTEAWRDIWVVNDGDGFQGEFWSDTISPYYMTGASVEQCIVISGSRALTITRGQGAAASQCLFMEMPNSGLGAALVDMSSCVTSTLMATTANSFSLGTTTGTNNVTLARGFVAALVALPNFGTGAFTNRAEAIAGCTPANLVVANGGLKLGDGSYACPLNASGAYQ